MAEHSGTDVQSLCCCTRGHERPLGHEVLMTCVQPLATPLLACCPLPPRNAMLHTT
jgi:hypothetical protein